VNPLLLSALFSFAPSILSGIFGGDPNKRLREQLMQLMSPQNQSKLTNQFFQQNLASPAFAQGQRQIAAGANATQGQLANSLGARGIGTSGTGALLSSLIPSIVGQGQSQLNTSAFNAARGQAQNTLEGQANALTGTAGPTQTQQFLGGGLSSFAPMLEAWLKSKYPQMFTPGGMAGGGQSQGGSFNPFSPLMSGGAGGGPMWSFGR
jgi:hypothetical protein